METTTPKKQKPVKATLVIDDMELPCPNDFRFESLPEKLQGLLKKGSVKLSY